ncbi:hypothetical protein [Gracilibacillus thailandensis]|uniref:Uncharacterized protein n=1 Tax=Gracilibacillus thailandensis TaxID=563735 RepID=A0A6N7QVD7_9BACI|nr:hypothetical protein [Gracilibacillus thailandensis]MRI65112.1 hypothetical protein [Gracilibacillus thailandensis]
MNMKKVNLLFKESMAEIQVENHDDLSIVLAVTELQRNEDESSENYNFIEPRFESEVFISMEEAKVLRDTLNYVLEKVNKE